MLWNHGYALIVNFVSVKPEDSYSRPLSITLDQSRHLFPHEMLYLDCASLQFLEFQYHVRIFIFLDVYYTDLLCSRVGTVNWDAIVEYAFWLMSLLVLMLCSYSIPPRIEKHFNILEMFLERRSAFLISPFPSSFSKNGFHISFPFLRKIKLTPLKKFTEIITNH